MWRGEEDHGAGVFLPGRMRDVSQQGQSHRRGHRATKEAVCAGRHCQGLLLPCVCPVLTLLSPRKGGRVTVCLITE